MLADKESQSALPDDASESSGQRISDKQSLARAEGSEHGKYRLLAELGRGGMANVYLAVARGPGGFNKLVVLKCLRSDLANDPELLAMFLDEAKLAARLNHPHVVQTYEVGEYLGQPVIVMEYLEGQTLANLVQRAERLQPLSLPLHLRIIADTLDGLHYAHELADYDGSALSLVHRDISPQNVFVTFEGQVKVLDFGIAKAVTSQQQTATGILKGKIKYMAPEQMLSGPVDRRADVYAVGVLLWEAATGQRMWKGLSDLQVMNRVVNEGGQPLNEVGATVAPELAAIIEKALSRDPAQRHTSAAELAAAIEPVIDATGSGANHRAIGAVMRQLFEDAQRRARVVIETQLQEIKGAQSDPHFIPPNIVRLSGHPAKSGDSPRSTSSGAPTVNADEPVLGRRKRRRVVLPLVAGMLLGLSIVTVVNLLRRSSSAPSPGAAYVAVAAPTAAPSASREVIATPPMDVAVEIACMPRSATLYLDGQRLEGNPYTGRLLNDGVAHEVRAKAVGFAPKAVDILPDRDIRLAVTLDPLPPVTRGAGTSPAHAIRVPSASAARPVASTDCNPPYFIDTNGIKKFKPECLQ